MICNLPFLKFRFRQTGKFLKEIPVPYLVLLGGAVGILFYFCSLWSMHPKGAWIITGCAVLILLYRHLQRKDHSFLALIDENPPRIYISDYLLLLGPLLVIFLFRLQWLPLLGVLAGITVVSLSPPPRKKTDKGIPVPSFIPVCTFEIRSGFRQYGIFLTVLYTGACLALFLPYLSLFFLWFYTANFSQFYLRGEGRDILVGSEQNTTSFLRSKLELHLKIYGSTLLPVCVIYTFLYPAHTGFILYFIVAGLAYIGLLILIKYSFYHPGEAVTSGQTAIGFSFLGMIFPPFLLLIFLYLFKYYGSARKHLNSYLHAYD
ncbi:MAG: hypothetical protein LUG98_15405 [Tannerellaceae bacterium]|nr:hypothetical protein [Tannerellaceae bacterium]